MADEKDIESLPEDETWVFESLVNFLHGPLWKLPVSGFIEEKSVVFDPESYNDELTEERDAEYKKIHDEYKSLVDFMLGSFMEDLEVTPEQVEDACRSRHTVTGQPQQDSLHTKAALQQLSAAEDFETFRRLMTRKNIDLQLQSLELLVSKYGGELSPALRTGEEGSEADDDFLQLVLRYTHEAANLELEEENSHAAMHNELPPKAMHHRLEPPAVTGGTHWHPQDRKSQMKDSDSGEFASVISMSMSSGYPKQSPLVEAVVVEAEDDAAEMESPLPTPAPKLNFPDDLVQKTVEEIKSDAPVQRQMLASVRRALRDEESPVEPGSELNVPAKKTVNEMEALGAGTTSYSTVPVTEEDIQRRREYMRDQRDKLVAIKKRERERQISESDGKGTGGFGGGPSRPKSSKAAAVALKTTPKVTANEKSLAARKALANRLKQELQPK